jgi:hypothetical protein
MEEAAFINQGLFYEVIVPLLGVEGTAVLAISTPDESDGNYYSLLMDLQDPDDQSKPLFKTIRIGLACDACVAANTAATCTHRQQLVPPWKSNQRQNKMRKIMESDQHLFMRENLGMITSNTQYMFPAHMVNGLRQAPAFRVLRPCDVLFCAIDPSGGGTQSDYAMATVCVEHGKYGIVGLDHSGSGCIEVRVSDACVVVYAETLYLQQDINTMIYTHLRTLRRLPDFLCTTFVIYIEANMSWLETDRVAQICSRPELQPVLLESRDPKRQDRIGVITDENTKLGYVSTMRHLLSDKQLSYYQQLHSENTAEAKATLEDQLRQFRRAIRVPDNPEHAKYQVHYTGKGYSKKDDLVMALMMCCYWSEVTRNDPEFLAKAHQRGWQVG